MGEFIQRCLKWGVRDVHFSGLEKRRNIGSRPGPRRLFLPGFLPFPSTIQLAFAGAWFSRTPLMAQATHCWNSRPGNRARLLGGAVVGSVNDIDSVYYNPGGLALLENAELLLSGKVLENTQVAVEDESGGRLKADNTRFDIAPSFFAGEIKPGNPDRGRLAYSFLTRQPSKVGLRSRYQTNGTRGKALLTVQRQPK